LQTTHGAVFRSVFSTCQHFSRANDPNCRELVVKPIKRWIKRRSVPTQAQMNNLYKPPKFSMESRYAFLLQVCKAVARTLTPTKSKMKIFRP